MCVHTRTARFLSSVCSPRQHIPWRASSNHRQSAFPIADYLRSSSLYGELHFRPLWQLAEVNLPPSAKPGRRAKFNSAPPGRHARDGGTSPRPPPVGISGRDPSQPLCKIKKALPRLLFEMKSMENTVQSDGWTKNRNRT